jgi:hypothetical protein
LNIAIILGIKKKFTSEYKKELNGLNILPKIDMEKLKEAMNKK